MPALNKKPRQPVKYLRDLHKSLEWKRSDVERRGMLQLAPGQNDEGYGDKIHTDYMVKFDGAWHRVYCICWSNAGSLYVLVRKAMYFVNEYDIPDHARR